MSDRKMMQWLLEEALTRDDLLVHLEWCDLATSGRKSAMAERLIAHFGGSLERLLREGGWYLGGWSTVLECLDRPTHRSWSETARELRDAARGSRQTRPSGNRTSNRRDTGRVASGLLAEQEEPGVRGGREHYSLYRFDTERADLVPRTYQLEAQRSVLSALEAQATEESPGVLLHLGTGGGKTFVANNIVSDWLRRHGGYVLWITKDWWLLRQAALDRAASVKGAANAELWRLGGTANKLAQPDIMERNGRPPEGSVVYTSLQTFSSRRKKQRLPRPRPSLIVWDECHWGEQAAAGRVLRRWCRPRGRGARVPVLGLTATPRDETPLAIAYSKSFKALVDEGHLARPLPTMITTDVGWQPQRSFGGLGDFDESSLDQLAQTSERNNVIVDHYAANRETYKKTLLFACNIQHANELAKLANSRHGVGAAAVHSDNSPEANRLHVRDFITGNLSLLINVAKMTHGVDIPEIETVFLCRPTTSEILFSQMVGRGARIPGGHRGPASFHVVEFTDNLNRFSDALQTTKVFFTGANSISQAGPRGTPRRRHEFDPVGQFRTVDRWLVERFPELEGLAYRARQTFGVEMELAPTNGEAPDPGTSAWLQPANTLHSALLNIVGVHASRQPYPHYGQRDHLHWTTEYDSTTGWEVVSRVLEGAAGLHELAEVAEALDASAHKANVKVNHSTGMHLHLGWEVKDEHQSRTARRLTNVLLWTHYLEPLLGSLVSPSRVAEFDAAANQYSPGEPNWWCRPVSQVYRIQSFARRGASLEQLKELAQAKFAKCVSVNLRPMWKYGTVEVRLHSGTLDVAKIGWWFGLWSAILWMAEAGPPPSENFDARAAITPASNLPSGLIECLPHQGREELLAWIARRQAEVASRWERHGELRHWIHTT